MQHIKIAILKEPPFNIRLSRNKMTSQRISDYKPVALLIIADLAFASLNLKLFTVS